MGDGISGLFSGEEKLEERKINGVKLIYLITRVDDRGDLVENWRKSWNLLPGNVSQVYTVHNPRRDVIRAYHKHDELWDLFSIVNGSAKFRLKDDRKESSTYGMEEEVILGVRKPGLLVVPPGVYHGWMSLEDNTILLSIASHEYNREKPDEYRIPFDSFGADKWNIKPR